MAPASPGSPQPCAHCGAVMPLQQLLALDDEGDMTVICQGCAIELPPEQRARARSAGAAPAGPTPGRRAPDGAAPGPHRRRTKRA